MAEPHRTYCRNCPGICGLVIESEDDRITSIAGDGDHPMTEGYLCIKGLTSQDLHNGEDRLLCSKKRQEDGRFVDIETATALDEIHDQLSSITEQYGPGSVALYYGTGANNNSLCHCTMKGWLDLVGTPNIFSSMTVDQSAKWVTMGRMGMFPTGKHVVHEVDVVLLVGTNPPISHVSLPWAPFPTTNITKWIRKRKAEGAKYIVIDPRKTEMARFADIHLQLLPGEDAALLAGMIHLIFKNGWENKEFCRRYVDSIDTLKRSVRDFTPDYASKRAGVPQNLLEDATRVFVQGKHRSASSGTGPNMAPHSNLAEHLVECLNVITGAYRQAGDLIRNPGTLFEVIPDIEQVIPPNRSWEREPKLRTTGVGKVFGEYPSSLLPWEILSPGDDRIRALIVVGGNPVTSIGDPEKTVVAFENLDLLVTLDPRMTKTGQLSHYVIPTKLPYERHDITGLMDSYMIEPFVQIATPVIEPPEGVVDDWEFFWELAKRMNRTLVAKPPSFGVDFDQIPDGFELDMSEKPETIDLIRWMCDINALPFEEILAHPQGLKIERDPVEIRPAAGGHTARLDVCPADVAESLTEVRREEPDSRYRFRLSVRRILETMNSAYSEASRTRRRYPTNPAYMNPEDMDEEGLENDSKIRVSSDAGSVIAYVKVDRSVRRGVISMSHQWGALDPEDDPEGKEGAFTGRLVSIEHNLEKINFMPRQSGIPVNIQPLAE